MAVKFRVITAPTETLQSNCIMNSSRVQPVLLAQLGEHLPYKQGVECSSHSQGIMFSKMNINDIYVRYIKRNSKGVILMESEYYYSTKLRNYRGYA